MAGRCFGCSDEFGFFKRAVIHYLTAVESETRLAIDWQICRHDSSFASWKISN